MISLQGKTALITGANGAIGRATARLFHRLGASLVLTDVNEAALADFCAEIEPGGERIASIRQDAARIEEARAAALERS